MEVGNTLSDGAHEFRRVRVADRVDVEFALDPHATDPISAWLRAGLDLDEAPLQLVMDLLDDNGTLVDIGAHIGTFSLTAAALGARVLAVEASPVNSMLLEAAARHGDLVGVQVINAAAADAPGEVPFAVHGPWGFVSLRDDGAHSFPIVTVPAAAVDDLIDRAGITAVDVVKIDVEGWEPVVLKGLTHTLEHCRPAVMIEVNTPGLARSGATPQSVLSTLAELGYRLMLLDPSRERRLVSIQPTDPQPETVRDYLALPPDREPPRGWTIVPRLEDDELVERFVRLLSHNDPETRRCAIEAALAGPCWLRDHTEVRAALNAVALEAQPTAAGPQAVRRPIAPRALPRTASSGDHPVPVYDSDHPGLGPIDIVRNLRNRRRLVRVLAARELAVRYRRSSLGVIWTLLYPALTALVMWGVFSRVFPVGAFGVPYIVYLYAGVVIFTTAAQAIQQLGGSLMASEALLTKVYIPSEILAAGSAVSIAINSLLMLMPLFVLELVVGVDIPPTAPLALVVMLLLLAFALGIGMLVATAAVRFPDALPLTGIVLGLVAYLTPTFYPLSVLPSGARAVVKANPLTTYLSLLRDVAYRNQLGSLTHWSIAIGAALIALGIGTHVYVRAGRHAVVIR